jgi:hypothetical protein
MALRCTYALVTTAVFICAETCHLYLAATLALATILPKTFQNYNVHILRSCDFHVVLKVYNYDFFRGKIICENNSNW